MKNFSNLIVKLTNFVGFCFCFHFLKVKQTYIWIELGHFLGPNTRKLCTINNNSVTVTKQTKRNEDEKHLDKRIDSKVGFWELLLVLSH